ncbi:small ribosomal subunit protein bS6m [Haliaeetus albicilla]|uniref:small ribosomal subunit protein bS6m n=2 Tax=Haliaeetus TaxID=8968 RepID=UPI0037E93B11
MAACEYNAKARCGWAASTCAPVSGRRAPRRPEARGRGRFWKSRGRPAPAAPSHRGARASSSGTGALPPRRAALLPLPARPGARGRRGRGRRRPGARRRGPPRRQHCPPPPLPSMCGLGCVCARARSGGGVGRARGRTQWKFPLPAAATAAAAAAAAGRRKAGAGPAPPAPGRRRPRRASARPPASGLLPGGGCPPSRLPLPLSPGRGGGAARERAGGSGPPAGGRVCGGGGACRGQGAARRSLRSCWRPFKPRRPLARPGVCAAWEPRGQESSPAAGDAPSSSGSPPLRHRRRPHLPTLCPDASPLLPPQASSKMPRYELALILKAMQRPETAAVLKRTVEALMERGAIVRNLENLGERSLPYKISKHKERHRRGGYFLIDLEGPPSIVSTMMDHLGRDIDVIRRAFIKHPVLKTEECSGIIPVNYEDKLIAKKK